MLGRKQSVRNNEDWKNALDHIEETASKKELDSLVKKTVKDIKEKCKGKKAAYAWSAGKDSLVLGEICEKAGIDQSVLVRCNLEYTQYMKQLKESNEYGYIWRMHHSLQISTSHYVPAEDGAIRLMDGYLPQLYHLRDQMRDKFGLLLLSNFEDYPQEKSCELDSYYEKIYIALKAIDLEDSKEHTNDRYYITRKKYRTVNGKGFFEYTLSYAQEEITKFDRFVAYSFNDIPDNYSIQCDFYQSNIDFNGVGIDIKCLIAWNVAIRPCELEKLARICGYDIVVKSDNLYYKALMKFLSRTGMNLLDILLADNEEYEIYIQQIELSKKTELKDTFDKIREVIIKEKPGSNILRYITAYLKNDVIRDQLEMFYIII